MNRVSIKSCNDGTELIFKVLRSSGESIDFIAEVSGSPFIGSVETSTYVSGPPSLLFSDIAKNWRGWKGEKTWSAIDGEFALKASSNLTGSVRVIIEMVQMSGDFQLVATLGLEAGQLEAISKRVSVLFQNDR